MSDGFVRQSKRALTGISLAWHLVAVIWVAKAIPARIYPNRAYESANVEAPRRQTALSHENRASFLAEATEETSFVY